MKPLDQIDHPPTHHPVDRRDRSTLDDLHQRPALGIVEDRGLAWSLPVKQAIGSTGIEPHHPVAHDLEGHATDFRSFAPTATVVNLRQCQ